MSKFVMIEQAVPIKEQFWGFVEDIWEKCGDLVTPILIDPQNQKVICTAGDDLTPGDIQRRRAYGIIVSDLDLDSYLDELRSSLTP